MEEDIKIGIEKMIKDERIHDDYRNFITDLENLLTRYKQLEEENRKLNNANKIYINAIQSIAPVLMNDYIEKSKIKEKIEEYKNMIKERPGDKAIIEIHINELQELLEED